MRTWLVLAGVAAASSALAQDPRPPATPPEPNARESVVTDPDWVHRPGPDEFSRYWPEGATTSGLVAIKCTVTDEGTLTACVVQDEDPPNQGFGDAALKIAQSIRMKPKSLNGRRVGGKTFRTMLRFYYDAAREAERGSGLGPRVAVITNPDWLRRPGPDEFSRFFPTKAKTTGVVSIECNVTDVGKLTGCVVRSEDPQGEGFGEAALKIAPYFQMKPKALDGKPVGGGLFQQRIVFTYDGGSLPSWLRRPTEPEILAAWPEQAPGVVGQVTLKCDTDSEGLAVHCEVNKETPAGKGFGSAALKLAADVKITPSNLHGVLIPINFIPPKPRQVGAAKFGDSLAALTNAPWRTAPSAADIAAGWPKAAPADLVEAKVRLSCGFQPDSTLGPCDLLSDEPPGMGFGAAALALVSRFRLREAFDPATMKNARLILPVTFENPALSRQSPERLTQFNWVTFIDPDAMTALYPGKAADAGIKTGHGVLDCTVSPGGALTDCVVESEDPPGMGFGEAAVKALASFTVNPWTDDGHPVDGAKIRVPIRMNEAEQDAPAPTPPAPTPPAPVKPGG